MSRLRSLAAWAKVAIVPLTLAVVTGACDEDGKSLPANCADPLPLDDLGSAGTPDVNNPCLTEIGHAVSYVNNGTPSGGTNTGGTNTGGTNAGGTNAGGVSNGQGGADAGAGGS